MNSNLWLVLGTAVLFGLATGIYEYVLPHYLASQGISFLKMGAIFAIAGAGMVLVREAGGFVTDMDDGDKVLEKGHVIAGNEAIRRDLLSLVRNP